MRRTKIISVFFCVFALLICGFTVLSAAADETAFTAGNTIEFGSYPQSRVTDETLSAKLNEEAAALPWQSYGYNVTGGTDFAFYKDVTYESVRYRAVYFTLYRHPEGYGTAVDYGGQSARGYETNTVYWFRYDPISWTVLDPEQGLVIANVILDSQAVNDVSYRETGTSNYYGDPEHLYYLNNYAHSTIRTWLSDTFAQTAFSAEEAGVLREKTLSDATEGMDDYYSKFAFESTQDAVFLLSYAEALNNDWFASRTARVRSGTDYAMAQGLNNLNPASSVYFWFLRSPGQKSEIQCYVSSDGQVDPTCAETGGSDIGICPAAYLSLADYALLGGSTQDEPTPDEPTVSPYENIVLDFADGILTVSGTGALPTVTDLAQTPLAEYAADCKVIVAENGITAVNSDAFAGFNALNTLILNGDITLDGGAFAGNGGLETVICAGTVRTSEAAFPADQSIRFYEPKGALHIGALPEACNVLPYAFEDGTLVVEGDVEMDVYALLDLMTAMSGYSDEIRFVRFHTYVSLDLPFYVYDEAAGRYVNTEDDTLRDVSFSVWFDEAGEWVNVSFNEFCVRAADENVGTFYLVAQTQAGEDIQPTGLALVMQHIQEGFHRVLKWVVGLLNYMFNLLSKFKKK